VEYDKENKFFNERNIDANAYDSYFKNNIYGDYSNVLDIDMWATNILKQYRKTKGAKDTQLIDKYEAFFKNDLISTYGWGNSKDVGKKRISILNSTMEKVKKIESMEQEKQKELKQEELDAYK
jgi:hypothetical protein